MTGEDAPEGGVEAGSADVKPVSRRPRRLLLLALPVAVILLVSLVVIVNRDTGPASSVVPAATLDETSPDVYPAPTSTTEAPPSSTSTTNGTKSAPTLTTVTTAPRYPVLKTAPRVLSIEADASGGTVTLTFDQAVEPSTLPSAGMNVVFHTSSLCDGPTANGHEFLSGAGTPTIVLASSYTWPGTAHVKVGPGVVTGVGNGLTNEPSDCITVDTGAAVTASVVGAYVDTGADPGRGAVTVVFDRGVKNGHAAALGVFDDPACVNSIGGGTGFATFAGSGQAAGLGPANGGSVTVATDGRSSGSTYVLAGPSLGLEVNGGLPTPASGCIRAEPFNPPVLVSATGDLGQGQITLHFSRPVDGGDPSTAMRLVVHTTDSTCSSPNGNAHAYLSGLGTDTITVEATSLVAGTTYISIVPGFVHAADGTANRAVGCYALPVS